MLVVLSYETIYWKQSVSFYFIVVTSLIKSLMTPHLIRLINIYPDMAKHQSKPQIYKSDIAPCGQI